MATIRTAIQLQDGMTPVIRPMINALQLCTSSFEAMQNASGNAVNVSNLSAARVELNKASMAMDSVERNVHEATAAQRQFNNEVRNSHSAAEGLVSKVKQIAAGIAAAAGAKQAMDLSDEFSQTTARLNLMNDGMQTTAQLQNMIFQSAQRSRGAYLGTAQTVAKLGILAKDAFSSNGEIIAFAEQMNKQFKIGGASIQEQAAGMYQLTQAMASGRLQGDEFRSIIENAPMLAQAIAKYTGKSMAELREMSSEGQITADIIKKAMFAAADETNERFAKIPKTFGDIWASVKNGAIKAFEPVLTQISGIANSQSFQSLTEGAINGLVMLAHVAAKVFNEVVYYGGLIRNNWSFIAPVVWGVVAAYAAYNVATLIAAGRTAIATATKIAHAAASAAETMAIIALIAAQEGLNAALYACPISWILMAVVALIAIFYLAVAAVNKFAGSSLSATGIIVGAFFWLGGMIYNVIALAWNTILSFAEFLGNVFRNPTAATYNLFATIWNGIVEIVGRSINEIIGLINKLPGMELGFINWGKGLAAKQGIRNGVDLSRYQMDYSSGNFMTGYNLSQGMGNFNLGALGLPGHGSGVAIDPTTAANIADTAANTGKMKDSLDITEEDLKYLRDIAEQEVINRYTTAEIKFDMTNHNNVSSNMDLDGMTNYLRDTLVETMQVAAEKVHK